MKKQAKDIRMDDRFSYTGSFTIYRAVSNPEPDESMPDRVVFEVVNERWGPARDKKPIGIRLVATLEVEVEERFSKPDKLPQVLMDALHQLHAAGVGTRRIQGLAQEFGSEPYLVETKGRALLYRNGEGELYSAAVGDAEVEDDIGGYEVFFGHDRRHIGRCDAYGSARGYWRSSDQRWTWVETGDGPTGEPESWWDEMAKLCERLGRERRG